MCPICKFLVTKSFTRNQLFFLENASKLTYSNVEFENFSGEHPRTPASEGGEGRGRDREGKGKAHSSEEGAGKVRTGRQGKGRRGSGKLHRVVGKGYREGDGRGRKVQDGKEEGKGKGGDEQGRNNGRGKGTGDRTLPSFPTDRRHWYP